MLTLGGKVATSMISIIGHKCNQLKLKLLVHLVKMFIKLVCIFLIIDFFLMEFLRKWLRAKGVKLM